MRKILLPLLFFVLPLRIWAQIGSLNELKISETKIEKIINRENERGVPSSSILIKADNYQKSIDGTYLLKIKLESGFTSFAIGWNSSDISVSPNDFKIEFKLPSKKGSKEFGRTHQEEGYVHPTQTVNGYYWSDLFFGYDESPRNIIVLSVKAPEGVSISDFRIDIFDYSKLIDENHAKDMKPSYSKACPAQPAIIPRSEWCSYTACTNATYTPTTIYPTHTVIHHGASPDTYTDGYAVVSSYWNYHVNTLGWSDIGYNYLIDKYGNLFQGRKNASAPTVDVQGAHAGSSNTKSIGINFMGNADVTLPTTAQLEKLHKFLGWWYKNKNLDPTTSASITLQSGGTGTVSRICGHKDVNVGGTSCPGTVLYSKLASIRTETKAVMDACNVSVTVGSNSPVCAGKTLYLTTPTVVGASYSWTGPGGFTSVEQNPKRSYSTVTMSGEYNLTVTVGTVVTTGKCTVLIQPKPATPTATSNSPVCVGDAIFFNTSSVTDATYSWKGPNSFISTTQNPILTEVTELMAGTYTVSVTINGCTSLGKSIKTIVSVCNDSIKPTTKITSPGWKSTGIFESKYTDVDNLGSTAIKYRFFQVTDFNGTEWRSNNNSGFFNDNFDVAIHSDWTSASGNWLVENGVLKQTDPINANSNLYSSVSQVSGNVYLYNWKMKISGTGTNKRAGLHFFSDDASQSNRNNSYMVYFRADGNVVQIYEYTANTMYLKASYPCTVTPDVMYDYKVILNSATGEIITYQNDVKLGSWTDITPLTVGNQISLRSAECTIEYDDVKVFKSRGASANISVGNGANFDIRYQNANSKVSAGRIESLITDGSKNISALATNVVKVDFWGPYPIANVFDGITTGVDIDSQTSLTTLSANWTKTTDVNNTISKYWYAIGTTPGGNDVVDWTNNTTKTYFTRIDLALIVGKTYYVSVKAQNAALLYSTVKTSNGIVISAAKTSEQENITDLNQAIERVINIYPNPASDFITIDGLSNKLNKISIMNIAGVKIFEYSTIENNRIDISELKTGIYLLMIDDGEKISSHKFIKN